MRERRTVRDRSVEGFFVMAVVREGVGESCEVWLEHAFAYRVIESLVGRQFQYFVGHA